MENVNEQATGRKARVVANTFSPSFISLDNKRRIEDRMNDLSSQEMNYVHKIIEKWFSFSYPSWDFEMTFRKHNRLYCRHLFGHIAELSDEVDFSKPIKKLYHLLSIEQQLSPFGGRGLNLKK